MIDLLLSGMSELRQGNKVLTATSRRRAGALPSREAVAGMRLPATDDPVTGSSDASVGGVLPATAHGLAGCERESACEQARSEEMVVR